MSFENLEFELSGIIGADKTNKVIPFLRSVADETPNILDVYYKILPNEKVYFFKRYLDSENKITIERIHCET